MAAANTKTVMAAAATKKTQNMHANDATQLGYRRGDVNNSGTVAPAAPAAPVTPVALVLAAPATPVETESVTAADARTTIATAATTAQRDAWFSFHPTKRGMSDEDIELMMYYMYHNFDYFRSACPVSCRHPALRGGLRARAIYELFGNKIQTAPAETVRLDSISKPHHVRAITLLTHRTTTRRVSTKNLSVLVIWGFLTSLDTSIRVPAQVAGLLVRIVTRNALARVRTPLPPRAPPRARSSTSLGLRVGFSSAGLSPRALFRFSSSAKSDPDKPL